MKRKIRISEEEANVRDKNVNAIRIGKYLGVEQKTEYKCNYCNEKWETRPYLVWNGSKGHPSCSRRMGLTEKR